MEGSKISEISIGDRALAASGMSISGVLREVVCLACEALRNEINPLNRSRVLDLATDV